MSSNNKNPSLTVILPPPYKRIRVEPPEPLLKDNQCLGLPHNKNGEIIWSCIDDNGIICFDNNKKGICPICNKTLRIK